MAEESSVVFLPEMSEMCQKCISVILPDAMTDVNAVLTFFDISDLLTRFGHFGHF